MPERSWMRPTLPAIAAGVVSVSAATLVMVATRGGLRLSPDSITYLAVADHVHTGRGLSDFTGDALTVFGPVYPLVLAVGGRSVAWARLVSAACIAAAVLLMYIVLRRSVRPWIAVAAAAVLGGGQCLVLVASSAWSETPYVAFSLAVFVVLLPPPDVARCAGAGVLAALGFLTRYAGASLIVTGAAIVVVAGLRSSRAERLRLLGAYVVASTVVSGSWILHNLAVGGGPLGPRFEGGTSEPWRVLVERPFTGFGQVLVGDSLSADSATTVGALALASIAGAGVVWAVRGTLDPTRVGMLVYSITNFVLPVIARALTSNDISSRVMSPMLIPLVYVAAVAADSIVRVRVVGVAASVLVVMATCLWLRQGIEMAAEVPDLGSSGSRTIYSPELHDVIDDLPADAQVLTNNPWGVWWQNGREPTLFAFTRPRPGNSHYPISIERLIELACARPTYLAWFPSLLNAGDGPQERRPDLLDEVDLVSEQRVSRGELYRLEPRDATRCPVNDR